MRTIYLLHDDMDGCDARQSFFEMVGYRVTVEVHPSACMEALGRERPSLLLMDALLRGKNGFDLLRDLRAVYKPRDLPVILCSRVYVTPNFRDHALNLGAQRYLVKPIALNELMKHAAEVIQEAERGMDKAA